MSELKFKTYNELEISEALSDASHVIIEENGDVKRFPANNIGKVKTVNGAEPDENGNVAVQPDLSQNDPEAPDYVKGVIRQESLPGGYPYKTETENVILPETEFTTVESDGMCGADLEATGELIIGNTYNVTFNGDKYTCVAYDTNIAPAIGNGKLVDGDDTGEPFFFSFTKGMAVLFTESANTYTISIKEVVYSYSKIDENYLPDSVAGSPIEFIVSEDGTSVSCDLSSEELLSLSVHDLQKRCVLVDGRIKVKPQSITTGMTTSSFGMHTSIMFVASNCGKSKGYPKNPVYVVIAKNGEIAYVTGNDFRVADIVRTATIGQTIVVKSVDDTGKPTEWEAHSLPEGVPVVTTENNGAFLRVVNGAWAIATVPNAEGVTF